MDDINRKRLEWMANAKVGEIFPNELFSPIDPYGNGWGPAVTAAIKDALAEIDNLRQRLRVALEQLGKVSADLGAAKQRVTELESEIESQRLSEDYT